jgi:polyhydroxyalkanoate synthesis regulator phasin
MVRDAIKRYVEAAQSLTEVPRERAEQIARTLAGSGLIDGGQIRGVASDIVGRSRENRRKLTDLIAREIRRQVSRIGFASKEEVERLRQRVQALEISDRRNRQAGERTPAKRTPATKAASKAGAARKRTTARR